MRYYYLIAPSVIVRTTESAFTYHHDAKIPIGTLVRISVGKKLVNGVVVKKVEEPTFKTKAIGGILTENPLPTELIGLANWLAEYYATHLATVLQTILPAGLHKERRKLHPTLTHPKRKRTKIVLNTDQSAALSMIGGIGSGTCLLHGVTGSGKTQLYIEAAREVLQKGKSVILLVPEISLTPQLLAEFSLHFKSLITTHSKLTESKRHQLWNQVLNAKEPIVVIGPRSALFMPLKNVGLIVIDECHEPSYKQEQSPRYSALRAASILASAHHAKLLLGSATPSIADYYIAMQNNTPIPKLPKPAAQQSPTTIKLIDVKTRTNFTRHRFLSNSLIEGIEQTLAHNQQVLLFHNRRGTAPTTICENCGWSANCPLCFLPLTLHADSHLLRCHLCGYKSGIKPNCPECKEPTIVYKGIGTKLIESEVNKLFPRARIARFDADNSETEALHSRYQELYDGKIDIVIGTQIVAKGLDLPNLSLVGIIQADSGLILPDYAADERVFQLLYQVIGRVGRGKHPGKVVIQTFQPTHQVIQRALNRDYNGFYKEEVDRRKKMLFPPFCYLLKLTCSYKTESGAINASSKYARTLKTRHPHITILGPTPAFHERLGGTYRWQLIIKSKRRAELAEIAKNAPAGWMADLDPSSIL